MLIRSVKTAKNVVMIEKGAIHGVISNVLPAGATISSAARQAAEQDGKDRLSGSREAPRTTGKP